MVLVKLYNFYTEMRNLTHQDEFDMMQALFLMLVRKQQSWFKDLLRLTVHTKEAFPNKQVK